MSLRGPSDGEIKMALAELLRQDETIDLAHRREIRAVTGYWDTTVTRYPGTSSRWEQYQVTVGYRTWDGEYGTVPIDSKMDDLLRSLATVVEEYGDEL